MEGPSLFLAAEQLQPFVGESIITVKGNTKLEKERLIGLKVEDIFSFGKHLVFQFKSFALRVHFLLFGTFEATFRNEKITGDYEKTRVPRLQLDFPEGNIAMYNCSLVFIESSNAKELYDNSINIMSPSWDSKKAIKTVQTFQDEEIGDVLLDQAVFAGVGNIIKNEVLFLEHLLPEKKIDAISLSKLRKLIDTVKRYSLQFYEWRKQFVLRKHFQIYRKRVCPRCQSEIIRVKTGKRKRMSYYCAHCQK